MGANCVFCKKMPLNRAISLPGVLLKYTFAFIGILAFPLFGISQISFERAFTEELTDGFRSGVAMGVADLNGNFRDDLMRQDRGRSLYVDFQKPDGSFLNVADGLSISSVRQWNIVSGDFNRNGLFDIVSAGFSDGVNIFRQAEHGVFEKEDGGPSAEMSAQTANVIDIDGDGNPDLFVADDDAESKIFANTGDGSFVDANHWIDMATIPESDNSGNYGTVWSDVSGNGKMDLYISKCKPGVADSTDPRRVNALFLNQGDGIFVEAAADYGLANGGQSWASDFGDINNNGRMDLITVNHPNEVVLYLNEGDGEFTDITLGSGLQHPDFGIQVKFADFDNDGLVDILIAGFNHFLYLNNGNHTFTLQPNPFDVNPIATFALGDLNDNGFIDVYAGYTELYNRPPGPVDDALWLNSGNDNHWLRFKLRGTESNRDGIGAILHAYSPLGKQTREVRAGESFGIQNSGIVHFGMGQLNSLDSLVVTWPSGIREVYRDLDVNEKYLLTEGACITSPFELEVIGELADCTGEGVELRGPDGFDYRWITGENQRSIHVDEQGLYWVELIDRETGCVHISEVVYYEAEPDLRPKFATDYPTRICSGEELVLEVVAAGEGELVWQDGSEGREFTVDASDSFYARYDGGNCGMFYSDTIDIELLNPALPIISSPLDFDTSAVVIEVEGDEILWYEDEDSPEPDYIGGFRELNLPQGIHPFYVSNRVLFPGEQYQLGKTEFEGSSAYPAPHINGGLIFDVHEDIRLESLVLFSDFDGKRTLELFDEDGVLVVSGSVELQDASEGQRVDLGWDLPPGSEYLLTTNRDTNMAVFGSFGPRLMRSNEGISFPYEVAGVADILITTFGASYYYYFYDWEITTGEMYCESERISFQITVDSTTSTTTETVSSRQDLLLYPNPASTYFLMEYKGNCRAAKKWSVFDSNGRLHTSGVLDADRNSPKRIPTEGLPPGLYIIELEACGDNLTKNLILLGY